MKRLSAIKKIISRLNPEDIVVSSNGMISREVFHVCDRPRNFYMMGSMGSALAIGLGIAYARPDLKVIVISGDGAVLMSLGTCALHHKLNLPNLWHYILDNNCYDTTGGQPTCSDAVNFTRLAPKTLHIKVDSGSNNIPRVPMKPKDITRRFKYEIQRSNSTQ